MSAPRDLSIGVDVGGTNTDAVVLDAAGSVLAWTKQPTTDDVTGGIRASIAEVLSGLGEDRARVSRVMLGTTHATNAIVMRRSLDRVAVVRLGAPASTDYPPLGFWPADLRGGVLAGAEIVGGGFMVDGHPIAPLDRDGIARFLDGLGDGFDTVAVSGIFSPSFPDQEREAADLIHSLRGEATPVFLSQDVGPIGLLERENATVLNAALHGLAGEVTRALQTVVDEQGLDAATYFAQNDGTLMGLDLAARAPVLTIGSGPANSIRGAAFLSGVENAIVVDIGGTTSDFGVLVNGFPRESTLPREIGGVTTNFRMPDILSIGLGGGSVVDVRSGGYGPRSVGHRIATEGLIFGGATPTLTDAAALEGDPVPGRTLPALEEPTRRALAVARERVHTDLADAFERMSLGRADLPLVVVGGGGFLVPDALPGVPGVVRPENGGVANAVGAARALAGGRADHLSELAGRDAAIRTASDAAIERAVDAGADRARVEIVEIAETALTYMTTPTVRVSVKAAGPLA